MTDPGAHQAQPHAPRRALLTIQAGRGLGALAVVLFHADSMTRDMIGALPAALATVVGQGYLAVDYFFIASGFIAMLAHGGSRQGSAGRYAFQRVSRIYLPYFPVIVTVIAIDLLMPSPDGSPPRWSWLTSLLLVPTGSPPALTVAWTLVHELIFYAVFLTSFVGERLFHATLAAWSAAILAAAWYAQPLSGPMATLLHPINLEFVLGILCAVGYRRIPPRYATVFWAAGFAAIVWFFAALNAEGPGRFAFAVGSALVLLGGVLAEQERPPFVPAALVQLGNVSYSLYLVHTTAIWLVLLVAANWLAPHLSLIAAAIATLVAMPCGYAYYRYCEQPALALARRLP